MDCLCEVNLLKMEVASASSSARLSIEALHDVRIERLVHDLELLRDRLVDADGVVVVLLEELLVLVLHGVLDGFEPHVCFCLSLVW